MLPSETSLPFSLIIRSESWESFFLPLLLQYFHKAHWTASVYEKKICVESGKFENGSDDMAWLESVAVTRTLGVLVLLSSCHLKVWLMQETRTRWEGWDVFQFWGCEEVEVEFFLIFFPYFRSHIQVVPLISNRYTINRPHRAHDWKSHVIYSTLL